MQGHRFGPEVYIKKAEEDICRTQLKRSLEEPAWDGYCGLVLLNEDTSWTFASVGQAHEDPSAPAGALRETTDLQPPPARFPPLRGDSEAGKLSTRSGSQQLTLQGIMQEIRGIADTIPAQRSSRLESLACRALEASQPPCDPGVAKKLLRLAEYACQSLKPAPITLTTQIQKSLAGITTPTPADASHPHRGKGSGAPREDGLRHATSHPQTVEGFAEGQKPLAATVPAGSEVAPPKMYHPNITKDPPPGTRKPTSPETNASAANKLYLAAVELLKRGELTKALENLEEALQACPLEKGGAIQQIRRHIAAVEGELKRKLALNGGGNMLTSTQGRKLTDGDVRQRA